MLIATLIFGGAGKGLDLARLITLKSALKLESKGLKIRRGVSCLAIARNELGIKARNAGAAYEKLCAMFAQAETIVGKEGQQSADAE